MAKKKENNKKRLVAVVHKKSNEHTLSVWIEEKYPHPKYGKIIKKHKSYLVHIETPTEFEIGEKVVIEESRPISKNKTWKFVEKVGSKK